jgi:hypothetical protein
MLRNSVDIVELKNRQTFPKNNYFCYRWRIKDHFNRSIDRQQFHLNAMGAGNDVSLMNDRIMQLYKSSFGSSRKDLIVGLAQEAMTFLERRRSQQKRSQECERALADSTISLVQHVFNVLLAFSAELNSLMGLSELFITPSEPDVKKVSNHKETLTHVVQAGFSTNLYRLVVDGRLDCINFYIVPSDTMLSLQEITLNYNPVEKWNSKLYPAGDVYWFAGESLMEDDMVEVICAQLLSALIQTTEERLMPPEQFTEPQSYNLFELAAPAPWEVDMQRLRTGNEATPEPFQARQYSTNSNKTDVADWQTQTARGVDSLITLEQFATPGLAEEIGLLTGYDIPALAIDETKKATSKRAKTSKVKTAAEKPKGKSRKSAK